MIGDEIVHLWVCPLDALFVCRLAKVVVFWLTPTLFVVDRGAIPSIIVAVRSLIVVWPVWSKVLACLFHVVQTRELCVLAWSSWSVSGWSLLARFHVTAFVSTEIFCSAPRCLGRILLATVRMSPVGIVFKLSIITRPLVFFLWAPLNAPTLRMSPHIILIRAVAILTMGCIYHLIISVTSKHLPIC